MRGSIRRRGPSWAVVVDLGYVTDPETGRSKRKQTFITVRGTKADAEKRLVDVLKGRQDGSYVDASKMTLGEWLTTWLAGVPTRVRPTTLARYTGIVAQMQQAPLAARRLQQVRATDLEAYYRGVPAAPSTVALHHTILLQALRTAVRDRLIPVNVAQDVTTRPKRAQRRDHDARQHCWTADEARRFLTAALAAGPQTAALFAVALDSGARKGELCGLRWQDVDLEAGTIRLVQQLLVPGVKPAFGPLKAGKPRTLTLSAPTVRLLAAHKRGQAEVKIANRLHYHDHGLVFAKDYPDLQHTGQMLGHPLQINNLGERVFAPLIRAAGVRRIKFHGLRHTCATLLLQAGEPVHVVSERLGHTKITMTLDTYSHVLPNMQQRAADTIGAVLHG